MFGRKKIVDEAFEALQRVESKFQAANIRVSFPNVDILDIHIEKNKWTQVPKPFAFNAQTMGLDLQKMHMSFLLHLNENGEIKIHEHKDLVETIIVLDGAIKDKYTGKTIYAGETYVIPKNQPHEITEITGYESYVYCLLSKDGTKVKPPKNWRKFINKNES